MNLTFEISGQAGYMYDSLLNLIDCITVRIDNQIQERLAPGQGHTNFEDIFAGLKEAGYDGWVSVEILAKPDPDTAAAQAAEYLRPLVDRYNAQ